MSRRKTQAELDAEAEAADAKASRIAHEQAECDHYRCEPTEWHWSGWPRVMRCSECGAENYLEDFLS